MISELAEPFGISLTRSEKVGRTRCIAGYRLMLDERLDRLGELLERTQGENP
jgi:hypothetical protein